MAQSAENSMQLIGAGTGFRSELCAMIEGTPLLGDLEWGEIEMLANFFQAYAAEKGSMVFHEGDPGDFMCLLIKGKVEVVKEDSSGERKVVSAVQAGKALGEMSLIDQEPRSASALAAEPTTLLVLTKENFERIKREHPRLALHLALKLARLLSQRLRQTSGMLVDYLG